MALELVDDMLVAHWNFGFLNGSMHQVVEEEVGFTQLERPTLVKFGVSNEDHTVVLSVNKK